MTRPSTRAAVDAGADRLRAELRGDVLAPGDPGYDAARAIWNAMIDRRPALIARPLGTSDVMACVRHAREHGLPISIKGGGHHIAGLAVADGALTLDLSRMRGVGVDPAAGVARVQPGCLLGDVDRETQLHGLAAVLGFVSTTGVAGLTLGGGFGYLTRRFGWTSDHVTAIDLVLADGSRARASEREHPDLFWGLRGGGGNFGVVTGFEYRLHRVGPEILGGPVAWPGERARAVLDWVARVAAEGPPELTVAAVLRNAPPAPWLPREIHGRPVAIAVICHTGDPAAAERDLAGRAAIGEPVGSLLGRRSYVSLQGLLDATQPAGRRYYWKSEYAAGFEPEMLERIAEHAATAPSPHSGIVLFPVGGAIGSLPDPHSAVGNRDAAVAVNVQSAWERADEDARQVEWARAGWRELRPFSTGGTYVNFLTEEEVGDRVRDAYGANFERLLEVKERWDPENFFRLNKNLARPAGSPPGAAA